MTNYERIKNMSVEELAREINHITICPCMPCNDKHCTGVEVSTDRCVKGIIEWLESETEE